MRAWIAVVAALMLAGCAYQPTDMSAAPADRYEIQPGELSVDNFAQAREVSTMDAVWSNDFNGIPVQATSPAFSDLLASRMRQQFIPGSSGKSLDVSILRAEILQKSRVADSVPIVGIFSALSPRDYKCALDANFRYDGLSVRQQFEHVDSLPLAWTDADEYQKQRLVNDCLGGIFSQVRDFTDRLSSR